MKVALEEACVKSLMLMTKGRADSACKKVSALVICEFAKYSLLVLIDGKELQDKCIKRNQTIGLQ